MLGLAQLAQFEQVGMFDPTNPNQRQYLQYAQIPGGYGSWYVNQVPVTQGTSLAGYPQASLYGLGIPMLTEQHRLAGLGLSQVRPLSGVSETWNGLPSFVQAGVVVAAGALVGFFGWKRFGGDIKKKIPGLSGSRRRR